MAGASRGRAGGGVGDEAVGRECRARFAAGRASYRSEGGCGLLKQTSPAVRRSVPALSCRTQNELDGDASRSSEERAWGSGRGCRAVVSEEVLYEIGRASSDHLASSYA
jgi:hypothetical protein